MCFKCHVICATYLLKGGACQILEAVAFQKCLTQDSVLAVVTTALLDSHMHQEKAANCHPFDAPAFIGTF